jgi:hypothetical protein
LGGTTTDITTLNYDSTATTPSLPATRHQHVYPNLLGSVTDQSSSRNLYLAIQGQKLDITHRHRHYTRMDGKMAVGKLVDW